MNEAKRWPRGNPGEAIPHEDVLAEFGHFRRMRLRRMRKRIEWTPQAPIPGETSPSRRTRWV